MGEPETIIRVENLGKKYVIVHGGRKRSDTFRDTVMNGLRSIRRRLLQPWKRREGGETREAFWALKDVSFEVKRGETIGVIGRNGAGKSTLLKILSRITEPTTGRVILDGRVASLLEVGTGFHNELTGRENIFLNGAILGMRRAEIARKFNEIVAFAEIEEFIDMPVKHYSSGMYMRLAFAVAAHLEQEILIVDEVLAVGDSSFQRKCMGKMAETAESGRTVLFVSHNMQAVAKLTERCILMDKGKMRTVGVSERVITEYLSSVSEAQCLGKTYIAPHKKKEIFLQSASVMTSEPDGEHICGKPISFTFLIEIAEPRDGVCFAFQVVDETERPLCYFWVENEKERFRKEKGIVRLECRVPAFRLYMGKFTITTYIADRKSNTILEMLSDLCPFEVTMRGIHRNEYDWQPKATVYLEDGNWIVQ